jgi:hypothetical protein
MRYRCSALAPNVRRFEMDGRAMGLGVGRGGWGVALIIGRLSRQHPRPLFRCHAPVGIQRHGKGAALAAIEQGEVCQLVDL